jgi:hypothetical protein
VKERVKHFLDLCIFRFYAVARLEGELDRAKSALEARKVIDRAKRMWGRAPLTVELLTAAKAVVRPDFCDAALDAEGVTCPAAPADGIGAVTGPAFDASDIAGCLACSDIKRSG